MAARYRVKCRLMRLLYARQWDRESIHQFFLVIDWMMALPPELETHLNYFIRNLEEEQKMEYVSSIERVRSALNRQEGEKMASLAMLTRLLTRRFGNLSPATQERLKSASKEQIEAWFDCAIDVKSLDEVFRDQELAH